MRRTIRIGCMPKSGSVYQTAAGGGAKIVDKFNGGDRNISSRIEVLGQRHSAEV